MANERPKCYETMRTYWPDKYTLTHGPDCGVNHTPGDPVRPEDLYFPLNLTCDPHARLAATAYAASVADTNPALASSLLGAVQAQGYVDPISAGKAATVLALRADEAARISTEGGG